MGDSPASWKEKNKDWKEKRKERKKTVFSFVLEPSKTVFLTSPPLLSFFFHFLFLLFLFEFYLKIFIILFDLNQFDFFFSRFFQFLLSFLFLQFLFWIDFYFEFDIFDLNILIFPSWQRKRSFGMLLVQEIIQL